MPHARFNKLLLDLNVGKLVLLGKKTTQDDIILSCEKSMKYNTWEQLSVPNDSMEKQKKQLQNLTSHA